MLRALDEANAGDSIADGRVDGVSETVEQLFFT